MKLNLDQTYIHSGKFYGPGETEVPDEVGKDLEARIAQVPPPPISLDSTAAGEQHPVDGYSEDEETETSATEKPARKTKSTLKGK